MIIPWLSIICAVSVASALPVSVVPYRQYVLLAPELPRLELPSTVKLQQPAPVQPVSAVPKSEPVVNRQYVLMYPSYQFVSTRQDAPATNPFQQFLGLIGFGQAGQNTQMMDAVEMDKPQEAQPQAQAQQQQAQNSIDNVSENKNTNKQKLYYTFATPASTVPLNADQRFFFVEQPQLFGALSGSNVNPVFNLQPVPVVLSRSNVAQPDDVLAQPNKVNSENVQKFSQIPPPAVGVEPVLSQVQGKSSVGEQVEHVPSSVVEHEPVLSVKHVPNVDHIVEPVPESKVNPAPPVVAVEDNRAVPVPAEPSVHVKSAAVVETRSNPVPIAVSSESVVVAPVVSPPTDHQVDVKDAVHPVSEVGLKELPSVHHDAVVAPVVQAVVDQHVGDKVEPDVVKQA